LSEAWTGTACHLLVIYRANLFIIQNTQPHYATEALETTRLMPAGQEKTEALKKAGVLRNAADIYGLFFAKRGRPPK
jgi:hypothetical protein